MNDNVSKIRNLIDKLNKYTKAYDEGKPLVPDHYWDDLYFRLKKLEESTGIIFGDSPTQHIPFEVKNSLNKVTHNHPMLSLDKTKDLDEIAVFVDKEPTIAMCKMDGLTCSLRYINGKLIRAETRGNGEVGEDITHNALHISSIPLSIDVKEEFTIDGEIICTKENFDKFTSDYKNPRNFAAGSIRLLNSQESASRNLTFVAWDCISDMEGCETLSAKLQGLAMMGFTVVPWTSGEPRDCIEELKECANKKGYPIDGIVFKYNNCAYYNSLGQTGHHARGGLAYKFYDEVYETKFRYFDFDVSRNGLLTPVAVFDPVDIEGTTVQRASLYNVSKLNSLCNKSYHVGDTLEVMKANMIIPQVVSWIPDGGGTKVSLPSICPICGSTLSYEESDAGIINIYCRNTSCRSRISNIIDHYASRYSMKINGLGPMTITKLCDLGYLSCIYDLYTLHEHRDEIITNADFTPQQIDTILDSIEKSKNCTLAQFLTGIGIPYISQVLAQNIVNALGSWDNFIKQVENPNSSLNIEKIGKLKETSLRSFDYTEAKKIAKLLHFTDEKSPEEISILNEEELTLKDKLVCISGKLIHFKNRVALTTAILSHGGKVTDVVSKKLDILICNDLHFKSRKIQKAQELGITILTEENFIKEYLL